MMLVAMLKKGALRGFATATATATTATHGHRRPPTVASVATVAAARAEKATANDQAPDPDRYCWPHSEAMNRQEIEIFKVRLTRFTDKGMPLAQVEKAADRLVIRDRENDDRALCLECTHLQGKGRWRCENWRAAEVAQERLAPDLITMLQRCPGLRLSAGVEQMVS